MTRRLRSVAALALLACTFGVSRSVAAVDVTVDAQTLTDLLSAMVPPSRVLEVTPDNRVTLRIEDVRVTGFDPAAADGGHILAALRLEVPELGLKLPVQPRLSLHLSEVEGRSVAYLQFEEVTVPIPLTGPLDVASLLPRIPVPADELNVIETARGTFHVRTRLADTRIGSSAVNFRFDIEVSPAPVQD